MPVHTLCICIAGAEVCVVPAHFSTIFVMAYTEAFCNSLQKLIPPAGEGLLLMSYIVSNLCFRGQSITANLRQS